MGIMWQGEVGGVKPVSVHDFRAPICTSANIFSNASQRGPIK
jgi:hypothetical protein